MKIAVLSDAHGNKIYFDRIINEVNKLHVSKIYYLGDIFGYGKQPQYIMKQLREINAHCLLGNHDAMLLNYIPIDDEKDKIYRIKKHREKLSIEDKNYLLSLLPFHEEYISENRVLFVHGSPIDPLQGYLYEDSEINIGKMNYNIVFMGHTHRPYIKQIKNTLFVNVGSCGLPRDIGNMPSFAVYDFDSLECQVVRVEINQQDVEESCRNVNEAVRDCLNRNTYYK